MISLPVPYALGRWSVVRHVILSPRVAFNCIFQVFVKSLVRACLRHGRGHDKHPPGAFRYADVLGTTDTFRVLLAEITWG